MRIMNTNKINKEKIMDGTIQNNEAFDLEEWVIALLNDISDADTYGLPYELNLSKERVRKISEAWDSITSITIV